MNDYFITKYGNDIKIKSHDLPPTDNLFIDVDDIINSIDTEEVIPYIKSLINKINPRKLIYLAVNGILPMAKIRSKRLSHYHQCSDDTHKNIFVAGTTIMKKIVNELRFHFQSNNNFIISDDTEPSESIYKIINYIKNHNDFNENSLIYGSNPNLLLMTLLLNNNDAGMNVNIFHKCKSVPHLENIFKNELYYLNIVKLGHCIVNDMTADKLNIFTKQRPEISPEHHYRYLLDFVLISSFAGNDFLPSFECVKFKLGGLDELIINYTTIDHFITYQQSTEKENKTLINFDILKQYIFNLSQREDMLLTYQKYSRDKPPVNRLFGTKDIEPDDMYHCITQSGSDEINVRKFGWQDRYYNLFFNIQRCECESMVTDYIDGLNWGLQYYTHSIIGNDWYFKYDNTVLVCDFSKYFEIRPEYFDSLSKNKEYFDSLSKNKELCIDMNMEMFLLIPSNNFDILPPYLCRYSSKILHQIPSFYPQINELKLFEYGKQYKHECYPILPIIDDSVLCAIKSIFRI